MAQGDLTLFNDFSRQLGSSVHTFATDTIKVMLIDDTTTPEADDTTPILTEYTTEVSGGTEYVAGGAEIANDTWAADGTKWKYDGDNITWDQDASGPTDIHWAIIYNADATDDPCIGFVEMQNGSTPVSLVSGDVSITWDTDGIFTVDA